MKHPKTITATITLQIRLPERARSMTPEELGQWIAALAIRVADGKVVVSREVKYQEIKPKKE